MSEKFIRDTGLSIKMELHEVSPAEYQNHFPKPYHVFNSVAFSELNKGKCKRLRYLLFKEKKVRFGIILGEKADGLYSPFSAPFGGFSFNKNENFEYFDQAVTLLKAYGKKCGKKIKVSFPPLIYNPTFISKMLNAFLRERAQLNHADLNYQFELGNFGNYEENLDAKVRKNLKNSRKNNFQFQKLDSENERDVERAYRVIKRNRDARGFPLRMTLQNVKDTIRIVPADFFILIHNETDVAAAQIFKVGETIRQVIYWGDLPEYSDLKVMNYFSYKIFEYYHSQGLEILDIGPSTEFGIPNYGLCRFKENIGCSVSLKYSVTLSVDEISFPQFDRTFLDLSWGWLNDSEIKMLTMTPDMTKDEQQRWFSSLKDKKDYFIQGVSCNGVPVGACGLKNITETEAEYWGYIGEKNYWGGGIGKEMLNHIEKYAEEKNIRALYLNVLNSNSRAISLYSGAGFQVEENKEHAKILRMRKILMSTTPAA